MTHAPQLVAPATVVNLHQEGYDVYIGRAGHGLDGYFGNPFRLESELDRAKVLEQYRVWFYERIAKDPEFLRRVLLLADKRLGCFCKPLACHGDVIAHFLNVEWPKLQLAALHQRRVEHTCHAQGCNAHVKPELLMCRRHWFMVPSNIRTAVNVHYRPGQCEDMDVSRPWSDAANAAIRSVFQQENPGSPRPLRILVCGSRNWIDANLIRRVLRKAPMHSVVIHGDNGELDPKTRLPVKGADKLAGLAAQRLFYGVLAFPADWSRGKPAGPERNQRMLIETSPQCALAFHEDPKLGKGTRDMVRRLLGAQVPVKLVRPDGGEQVLGELP